MLKEFEPNGKKAENKKREALTFGRNLRCGLPS